MNETIILNSRQKTIVNLLATEGGLSREQLAKRLSSIFSVSKATLVRDLSYLIDKHLIEVTGNGPSTAYRSSGSHSLLNYIDLKQYFTLEPDQRQSALRSFSKEIFSKLWDITSADEQRDLQQIFRSFDQVTRTLEPTILQRELERYVIELSWKSSKIEGNTYTLLETETLIKQGHLAAGKTQQEATMILNHKDVFKTIISHRQEFKQLSISNLLELHNSLTKNLSIGSGIRKQAVGITGTIYQPLSNEWEIKEALEHTIVLINQLDSPLEKAIVTAAMIAYIQPFADGNKRTARMMANAILMAHDYFPLSYRSVDENEYKEALILFYELNNLFHVKKIFIDQYKFALRTYFIFN